MQMNRAIFGLNLSVEATSLYILMCALLDQQETPTINRIRLQWNGTGESLIHAIEELMRHNVVKEEHPLDEERPLHINPVDDWRGA